MHGHGQGRVPWCAAGSRAPAAASHANGTAPRPQHAHAYGPRPIRAWAADSPAIPVLSQAHGSYFVVIRIRIPWPESEHQNHPRYASERGRGTGLFCRCRQRCAMVRVCIIMAYSLLCGNIIMIMRIIPCIWPYSSHIRAVLSMIPLEVFQPHAFAAAVTCVLPWQCDDEYLVRRPVRGP